MHPDHSAGLSDPATRRRYFSNAELVVHENEPPHWVDDAAIAKASERQQRLYFMCAREQITPYKDRTRLFQKGEVFPGVTAIPCHGHTPGHTSSCRSCVGWYVPRVLISEGTQLGFGRLSNIAP